MNHLIKIIYLPLFILGITSVWAGEVGNGGDVIVCQKNMPTPNFPKVELLDYYEAQAIHGRSLSLGGANLSVTEKVEFVLGKLARVSPKRAKKYMRFAKEFFNGDAAFIPGAQLKDISDSHHLVIPKGCSIEQIAIQKNPSFPNDPRYLINQDLWKMLSRDHQAGLVLHEIIYREALEQGHTDSIPTRYFNGLISSDSISKISMKEFVETLQSLKIDGLHYGGVEIALFDYIRDSKGNIVKGAVENNLRNLNQAKALRFYKNGSIWMATPIPNTKFLWKGKEFEVAKNFSQFSLNGIRACKEFKGGNFPFPIPGDFKDKFNGDFKKLCQHFQNKDLDIASAVFHKNGKLRSLWVLPEKFEFDSSGNKLSLGSDVPFLLGFHDTGSLRQSDLLKDISYKTTYSTINVLSSERDYGGQFFGIPTSELNDPKHYKIKRRKIYFHKNGNLAEAYIDGGTSTTIDNQKLIFNKRQSRGGLVFATRVMFHPNELLASGQISNKIEKTFFGQKVKLTSLIKFFESGEFKSGIGIEPEFIEMPVYGNTIKVGREKTPIKNSTWWISFHDEDNKKIRWVTLFDFPVVTGADGVEYQCQKGSLNYLSGVTFNDDGKLEVPSKNCWKH